MLQEALRAEQEVQARAGRDSQGSRGKSCEGLPGRLLGGAPPLAAPRRRRSTSERVWLASLSLRLAPTTPPPPEGLVTWGRHKLFRFHAAPARPPGSSLLDHASVESYLSSALKRLETF